MNLFEEIIEKLHLEPELVHNKAKIMLYGKKLAYFENVKKIFAFSTSELILLTKGGKVQVIGENLIIGRYGEGDLVLQGEVQSVTFME